MAVTDANGVQFTSGQPYFDFVLTNFFRQEMPDARNNSTVLLSMIDKRSKETVSGSIIVWPVRFGRSTGLGNMGYNGKLPDATSQNFRDAITTTRMGACRIALDGPTLRHMKTNGGAFTEPLRVEAEGIVDDVMIDRARQVHNDGSGRLGEVSAISGGATATITIRGNSSIEGATNKKWSGTIEQFFEPGTRVCFIANDGTPTIRTPYTAQQAAIVVSATANGANVDVVFSNVINGASGVNFNTNPTVGDWIVRCAQMTVTSTLDSAWRNELTGLGAVMSDAGVLDGVGAASTRQAGVTDFTSTTSTNFQGLNGNGTFAFNKGIVLDNGGSGNRSNTEELMQNALSDAERLNNANIELIMSSYPTYDAFVQRAMGDKRYTNTLELQTGHKVLTFNGIGWVKDRFAYQNEVLFLALNQLHLLETQPFSDLGFEDVPTWKMVQDIDKYWRGWTWEDQLVTDVRQRAGSRLTELSS